MENGEAGIHCSEPAAALFVFRMHGETGGVAARQHEPVRLYHAAGKIAKERMCGNDNVVAAVKRQALKQKTFNVFVRSVPGHQFDQGSVVTLVDCLIRLKVDRPFAGAVEQRYVRLLGKDVATCCDIWIPRALDQPKLRTSYAAY